MSHFHIVAAYLIFLASYLVFALGKFPGMKIDRPGMAIIGAVAMVASGILRPDQALKAIDYATIVLLFAMMVVVANLREAGFFGWFVEWVVVKLKPIHMMPAVIFSSGILSAFFVNDIVCLVMVPFVLSVTRRVGVKPTPYLLAVATSANIGSVATITGNPQNMLIGSYSGMRYVEFLGHLGPVAVAGLFLNWAILHFMAQRGEHEQPVPLLEPTRPKPLRKVLTVCLLIFAGFLAGLPPPMVAALGAALLLITRSVEPRRIYAGIDWGLLVFFTGLFVIMAGAENAGIVRELMAATRFGNWTSPLHFSLVVAVLSNLVSNVPAVMLLKSTIPSFADPHSGWLFLAMASTLAGNLTITGSVANLIVAEAARPEVEIGFRDYLRVGVPITVATMLFGIGWLVLIH